MAISSDGYYEGGYENPYTDLYAGMAPGEPLAPPDFALRKVKELGRGEFGVVYQGI